MNPKSKRYTDIKKYRNLVYTNTKKKLVTYGVAYFGKGFRKLMKDYSLTVDHIYSIYDGFNNDISPTIIGNVYNLRLIPAHKNRNKGSRSDMSLVELIEKKHNFDRWVGIVPKEDPYTAYKNKVKTLANHNLRQNSKRYFGKTFSENIAEGKVVSYRYTVEDGYKNGVDPKIIASIPNIVYVKPKYKNTKSEVTFKWLVDSNDRHMIADEKDRTEKALRNTLGRINSYLNRTV